MEDKYLVDSQKLVYHPERVAQWHMAMDNWEMLKEIYPIYIEISPSGACNHRCTFCALDYMGYRAHFLRIDVMKRIIPEMAELGVKSIMCGGEGEPLMNQDIIQLSKLIYDAGIDLAFTTNAVLLSNEFIDSALQYTTWLKASIDAGKPKTYARIHGTRDKDFHLVIKNLQDAVKARERNKLKCTLGAQMLLLPENASEVENLARICRDEIGLDYLIIKPYSQHNMSITQAYENINYAKLSQSRFLKENWNTDSFNLIWRQHTMEKTLYSKSYNFCYATPFFWAYIQANGDVYGCSAYLGDKRFNYGNINRQNFKDIWEGKRRKRNYEFIRGHLDVNTCRVNCRMDEINYYLWRLKSPINHVNFI